eukprot:1057940-Alexandrium_andersonii.AAC.1
MVHSHEVNEGPGEQGKHSHGPRASLRNGADPGPGLAEACGINSHGAQAQQMAHVGRNYGPREASSQEGDHNEGPV